MEFTGSNELTDGAQFSLADRAGAVASDWPMTSPARADRTAPNSRQWLVLESPREREDLSLIHI